MAHLRLGARGVGVLERSVVGLRRAAGLRLLAAGARALRVVPFAAAAASSLAAEGVALAERPFGAAAFSEAVERVALAGRPLAAGLRAVVALRPVVDFAAPLD
jgi:hypothetical protein